MFKRRAQRSVGRVSSEYPRMPKRRGRKPKRKYEMTEESSNNNSNNNNNNNDDENENDNNDYSNNNHSKSLRAAPPRTRSQVAPNWTTEESLILVQVIAAFECDWLKVFSVHQKWRIVVENCSTMGVSRTSNQCQTRWKSLLTEYRRIKYWVPDSDAHNSYWDLDPDTRNQFQLPEDFNYDLFQAIDDFVSSQMDPSDANPDTNAIGCKRHRQHSMPLNAQSEETSLDGCKKEQPLVISDEEETQQSYDEENLHMCEVKEQMQLSHPEEDPQWSLVEDMSPEPCEIKNHKEVHMDEKLQKETKETCTEGKEQLVNVVVECIPETIQFGCSDLKSQESPIAKKSKIIRSRSRKKKADDAETAMAEKLCVNAEMILAIVRGNRPEIAGFDSSKSQKEDSKTDLIRRQGDKLITCLEDTVNILNQFPHLVQQCD